MMRFLQKFQSSKLPSSAMQKNPSTLPKSFHCVRHYWNFLSISGTKPEIGILDDEIFLQPIVHVVPGHEHLGDRWKLAILHYLVNRRKVKNEEAERLYKLVGGRFVDLKFVADESLARQSFEVIEKSILDETEKKFRNAQINPKQNIIK
ncbi:unnamed protein product [Rhizophagus irregularis]|nr:unnamed protein product [Rhizophagus irregularis]